MRGEVIVHTLHKDTINVVSVIGISPHITTPPGLLSLSLTSPMKIKHMKQNNQPTNKLRLLASYHGVISATTVSTTVTTMYSYHHH